MNSAGPLRRTITLLPTEGATRLILNHTGLKKVSFLLEVDHFGHPGERVFFVREDLVEANLLAAPVDNVAQVALEHVGVETQDTTRHGVLGIAVLQIDGLQEDFFELGAELRRPEVRILELDRVDEVNAEIAVHGLVTKNILVLLGCPGHLVLTTQGSRRRGASFQKPSTSNKSIS